MSFHVVSPGLQSLVVDFGRPATRSLGVPVGGAADRTALALGNALVGNRPDAPALEIAMFGPTLRAEAEVGAVVFGAPFDLDAGGQPLVIGKTFSLKPDEVLYLHGVRRGVRAYLCVPGGFRVPEILNSRSALEPVRPGGRLACAPSALPARFLSPAAPFQLPTSPHTLRVLPGAQADWFAGTDFSARTFQVAPDSNRMGLRLVGEVLTRPPREMLSEPVCPGTVQVTNDGQCIILGVDGQTIGGYPKIAQVIRADLDSLGQLHPGTLVRFQPVTLAEAEALADARAAELDAWLTRIGIAVDCSGPAAAPSL
jgi:antagonist of KipI